MNKIDLESLGKASLQIDEVNTSLDAIRNDAKHCTASHQAFKGIDEYLTTSVMLIEEIIKNETTN